MERNEREAREQHDKVTESKAEEQTTGSLSQHPEKSAKKRKTKEKEIET